MGEVGNQARPRANETILYRGKSCRGGIGAVQIVPLWRQHGRVPRVMNVAKRRPDFGSDYLINAKKLFTLICRRRNCGIVTMIRISRIRIRYLIVTSDSGVWKGYKVRLQN